MDKSQNTINAVKPLTILALYIGVKCHHFICYCNDTNCIINTVGIV